MPKKLTQEEAIQKAREIHGDKYDYSLVNYKDANSKIKIICPIHGVFEQTFNHHFYRKDGCPKCKYENLSISFSLGKEEFIKKAREIHGDKYNYDLVEYKNKDTKVKIICPTHGVFKMTPRNHIHSMQKCPYCKSSHGEIKIQKTLEDSNYVLNETYFREYKFDDCKDKKSLPFDFYIPSKNLLIEYQGVQHYKITEWFGGKKNFLLQKHHDWVKRKYARDHNIELLTIPYWEFKNIETILETTVYKN